MPIEESAPCAVLRTLSVLGDMWTLGILRSVFYGHRRYGEMQKELGIATNVLADRLEGLVGNGILERVPYQERPLRHEYVLTEKGADLAPAILALREWGRRHLDWTEPLAAIPHADCGGAVSVMLACDRCGEEVAPLSVGSFVEPASVLGGSK